MLVDIRPAPDQRASGLSTGLSFGPRFSAAGAALRSTATDAVDSRTLIIAGWTVSAITILVYLWISTWVFQIDLGVYRNGAATALAGNDLYAGRFTADQLSFTYPPFAALAFAPLTWIATIPAQVLWTALTIVSVIALAVVSVDKYLAPTRARTHVAVALTVAFALVCDPTRIGEAAGQINAILALAIVLDLNSMTRRLPQGVLIGLAAGMKLIPLFLIAYLLVTRRSKAALRALLTFAVVFALGYLVLPTSSARYWFSDMWDTSRIGVTEDIGNQSLRATLARLFGGGQDVVMLWLVLGALLTAVVLVSCWKIWPTLPWAADGLVFAAMLLLSPVSWCAHWIMAVPIVLAGLRLASLTSSRALATAAWGLGAVMVAGPIWMVPRRDVFTHNFWQVVLGNSYVIAAFAVAAVMAVTAWRFVVADEIHTPEPVDSLR